MNIALKMPQEEIARETGNSFTTVNAWVNGNRIPRKEACLAIESAFSSALTKSWDAGESIKAICAQLHVEYGTPAAEIKVDPLDELFFGLCSLKASHGRNEETYSALAKKFRPWRKLLAVRHEDVADFMRKGGFGNLKAKAFVDIANRLKEDFGTVSLTKLKHMPCAEVQDYLLSLPGVGVKTARYVMMHSLGYDTIPVDAETYRVSVRLGIVPTSRNPDEAHKHFDAVLAPGLAYPIHINLVEHARTVCHEAQPECNKCILANRCPSARTPRIAETGHSALPLRQLEGEAVAVDIYAGCGGLSWGLKEAGFKITYALDWDKHACATHEQNFPETTVDCADVRTISGERILAASGGRIDLVAGGPNCQGVSQRGLRSPDDPRNFMFPEYLRLIEHIKPRMFLMENVPGIAHRHNFNLLREIFLAFTNLGYRCAADVLLAANYGVPQLRYRFVMIGTLGDEELGFPIPTHQAKCSDASHQPYVTISEAIGELPPINQVNQKKGPIKYSKDPESAYQIMMRDNSTQIHDHQTSATKELNLQRASHVPVGGNWKDIPPDLLPPRFFSCRLTDHSTTYARPRWDMPSFTVTSLLGNITSGAFTHPSQNRAFTVREGARLQSFPDKFIFGGPANSKYRQIGNAVPPLLAKAVGAHLLALLKGERPASRPPRIDLNVLNDERAWSALPVLTPRFKVLFGAGTRWPKGWGEEPPNRADVLDGNYKLRPEYIPAVAKSASD